MFGTSILQDVFEISSIGIRVNTEALTYKLAITGNEYRMSFKWHQAFIKDPKQPKQIGGSIVQSRLVM